MSVSREKVRAGLERFGRVYKATGAILLTTVLFFILLNVVCAAGLSMFARREDPGGWRLVPEAQLPLVFPDMDRSQRETLFRELAGFKFTFQPFSHFRARDCAGQYLNVRDGIRSIGEEIVWPPRKDEQTIFVFGGSTTFGHSADFQTIPAYLQGFVRASGGNIRVYNFGCVFYYSTQERIRFEQLLQAGHVPKVAVFIDGLNDSGHTKFEVADSDRYEAIFTEKVRWPRPPVVKAFRAMAGMDVPPVESYSFPPEVLEGVIDRYLANKKLIEATARAYGVTPVFVWQPAPNYKNDSPHYPFKEEQMGRYLAPKLLYPRMADRVAKTPMGEDFLWLADLQIGYKDPIYVDQCHYSPGFSKAIGEAIFRFLVDRKIVPVPTPK